MGQEAGKVLGQTGKIAECVIQGAPYLASAGACIAAPNPLLCVQGIVGAEQFVKNCCSELKDHPIDPMAKKLKDICDKLPSI